MGVIVLAFLLIPAACLLAWIVESIEEKGERR